MMIRSIKFIDKMFGPLIIFILSVIGKRNNNRKKILVVKLWALGDSVLTLVLLRAIRKLVSDDISVLVRERNRVIYEDNPMIKNIYSLSDMHKLIRKFDMVFDCEPYLNISAIISRMLGKETVGFSHGFRSVLYDNKSDFLIQHMVQNYLDMIRKLGYEYNTQKLEKIPLKSEDVDKFLKKSKLKQIAGLTIGAAESATENRMWPIKRFAKVADYLHEKGYDIIFVGSPKEKDLVVKCQSMMRYSSMFSSDMFNLKETIYLIGKFDIFISNDTGPMHIAAAQGVDTIGLFGANTPVLWGPYGKNNISLYHDEGCSPCIDNRRGTMGRCTKKYKCIKEISVEEVIDAIDLLI